MRWLALVLVVSSLPSPPSGAEGQGEGTKPLQPLIDATPTGGTLRLAPGTYSGPAHISRPMTLDGAGHATLDGQGRGTVLTVTAPGATVTGLHLTNSGSSHDAMDAALLVEASDVRVAHNVIDGVLFGVHVKGGDRNVICGNRISSREEEAGMRGDAVRVWNGRFNRVEGNEVTHARDLGFANAPDNVVRGNVVRGSRIGANLVFSPRTELSGNWLDGNLAGVAVMYSNGVVVRGNRVQHSMSVAGSGMAFKESSQVVVEHNAVVHCAVGAKTNAPTDARAIVYFRDNRFAHNVSALDFYGENGGHVLHGNRFEKNLYQVTVSAPMSARGHDWKGNHWDDYEGFDRDGDGVGDVPYERWAFSDRIWMEEPRAAFFRNSPALELLDFLERLAPFASPELTLADPAPRVGDAPMDAALLLEPPVVPSCPEAVAGATP
ncbi:MAG: nitrous oxide reductase family maturation protein NosD [Myxococcota bacterium]|jgi:nitrous oxidase accessory protein